MSRLHAEVTQALTSPELRERLAADGAEAAGTTPADFGKFIRAELEKWRQRGDGREHPARVATQPDPSPPQGRRLLSA